MSKLEKLWARPKYLPYVQPKLISNIIKEAESKIGFKLPEKYLQLLHIQNGGAIRYRLEDRIHNSISGIGPYFPSITNFEWLQEYEGLSYDINFLYPFDGDGHWNICLDYRKNKSIPQITYINTETDWDEIVANTFDEYLNQLELETYGLRVIKSNLDITEIIDQISNIGKILFEKIDGPSKRYPVYSARFEECPVVITPNEVSSGYAREGERRFEESKVFRSIKTTRYPEVSAKYYFIEVLFTSQRDRLFQLLDDKGIKIVKLDDLIK